MSGNRLRWINAWYFVGHEDANETNDAADIIIRQPDRFLLNQEQVFAAGGGWTQVALSLGLAGVSTIAVFAMCPRTASHFRNGQCSAKEWFTILGAGAASYWVGQEVGRRAFGDQSAWQRHWMAYTWIKAQNRFEGRRILSKAPRY